eukprot:TRINITY_DN98800_c0_g1_i1.p2 TRINITY_DN98800_c0_g1~~TRINITY_DN98800_c0_g1_i1.p2  ORF type:complete len:124 (+),score=5.75 TRINITY_DN98800_c0_g1_i1:41-373(+)
MKISYYMMRINTWCFQLLQNAFQNQNIRQISRQDIESLVELTLHCFQQQDELPFDKVLFNIITDTIDFIRACRVFTIPENLKISIKNFCDNCSCETLGHALNLADTINLS